MAEKNDAQEKTEQATPKRLSEARRKGQIARSRDLTTLLMLMGSAIALFLSAAHISDQIATRMTASFSPERAELFADETLVIQLQNAILTGLYAIAPALTVMFLLALFAPMALGGWSISGEQIKLDFKRLDLVKGIGRVFGIKGVTEMLKALAKFLLIGTFAAVAILINVDPIRALGAGDSREAIVPALTLVGLTFFASSAAMIFIAAVDVPLALWQHARELKMSRQEVKEELKETDGRPEVKSRIRQLQQETASRRMMEEVPQADVVITNPSHYSVALKYDPERMSVPKLVASGKDRVALRIRRVASDHEVSIVEAPALARAIYHTTKIGQDIPRDLYVAVAQVLAYVFQLRNNELLDDQPTPDPSVPPGYEF